MAWCGDSQSSSAHGLQGREERRDRVHRMVVAGRASSVVARIQPALRVQAFRRVQEWA